MWPGFAPKPAGLRASCFPQPLRASRVLGQWAEENIGVRECRILAGVSYLAEQLHFVPEMLPLGSAL